MNLKLDFGKPARGGARPARRRRGIVSGAGAAPERVQVVPPFHREHELTHLVPDGDALRRWQGRRLVYSWPQL